DDALRARTAAAAGMERIAFDLANRQLFFVDVRQDAAGRFAVEADARNDPVVPAILLGPTRRLEVDVIVPRGGIGVRSELRHRQLQDCRIAELQEGKAEGTRPSHSSVLQS